MSTAGATAPVSAPAAPATGVQAFRCLEAWLGSDPSMCLVPYRGD
jgi:hypothetical protein